MTVDFRWRLCFTILWIHLFFQPLHFELNWKTLRLKKALDPGGLDSHPIPLHFLPALEREIYIFLSLVDGSVARSVIVSALNEYGVPESEIYRLEKSPSNMLSLLQLLKVIVRTRGVLTKAKDITPLDKIIHREADFMGFGKGAQHMDMVGRVMKWATESKEKIVWDSRRESEKDH